jgi:hypothetical protein
MGNAKVTISKRVSIDSSHVAIEILDSDSGAKVVAFMELEDFAQALFGLGQVDAETQVWNIQFWDHTRTVEKHLLVVPNELVPGVMDGHFEQPSQILWENYLKENVSVASNQVLDVYLGTKGAIQHTDDSVRLTYRILTYTPKDAV